MARFKSPPDWTLRQRFEHRLKPEGDCLIFMGARTRFNYGNMEWENKMRLAHRLAWELNRGPIPKRMCVLHRCDNPPCCNVDHLWLGTRADNNRDMDLKKRRISKAHSILTEQQVLAAYHDPRIHKLIAKDYGVSAPTIGALKVGYSWSHVTGHADRRPKSK